VLCELLPYADILRHFEPQAIHPHQKILLGMHNEVEEDEKQIRNTAVYSKKSTARFKSNSESDHSNDKNSPKQSRSSRNSKNSEALDKDKIGRPHLKIQNAQNEDNDSEKEDPIKIEEGHEGSTDEREEPPLRTPNTEIEAY